MQSDTQGDTLSSELIKMYKKSLSGRNGNSSDKELIDISSDDDNDNGLAMDSGRKTRESNDWKKSDGYPSASISTPKEDSPVAKPETPGPVIFPLDLSSTSSFTHDFYVSTLLRYFCLFN